MTLRFLFELIFKNYYQTCAYKEDYYYKAIGHVIIIYFYVKSTVGSLLAIAKV